MSGSTVTSPLVSIITPTLNGRKFLPDCVQSVLEQTYPRVEHLIMDGASEDGSVAYLKELSEKHPGKIVFTSQKDKGYGCGEAWNRGLEMAKGDIIGWLGADDALSDNNVLLEIVRFFESNPEACYVYGGIAYVDENCKPMEYREPRAANFEEILNNSNPISWPSSFYRKRVVDEVGLVDDYGNDLDYLIRIAKKFTLHQINRPVCNFRVHQDSETGSYRKVCNVAKLDYRVSRNHGGKLFSGYLIRYLWLWSVNTLHLGWLYYLQKSLRRALRVRQASNASSSH